MRRHGHISTRTISEADLRVRALGVRRAVRELERQEPDLAEYVMETSTRLYARLDRACASHRAVKRIHEELVLLVLLCIEATRRSS
jgi:hypothetical protein